MLFLLSKNFHEYMSHITTLKIRLNSPPIGQLQWPPRPIRDVIVYTYFRVFAMGDIKFSKKSWYLLTHRSYKILEKCCKIRQLFAWMMKSPFYFVTILVQSAVQLRYSCLSCLSVGAYIYTVSQKSMWRYLFEHNSNTNCPIIIITARQHSLLCRALY